jgi:GNAT superfamily N-acetyltransferase
VTGEVTIRAVRQLDLGGLAELAGSQDRAEVRVRAAVRGEDGMLVAIACGIVVGMASVLWRDGCDPPNPWLYGLAVVALVRRRGIGRALVRAVEALCQERGIGAVSLDVEVGDRAAYVVAHGHEHHWRAVDPRVGTITGEGVVSTWIMRHGLVR